MQYQLARNVGMKLAEMGFSIVNGGYGGTMEASARGAKDAGASTIAVTCSLWKSQPNQYIDEVIETSTLNERIGKLIELGRCGYVVLPGATGTLAELAWVWELACKGFLPTTAASKGNSPRPIVCMGEFWVQLIEMIIAHSPQSAGYVDLADTVEQLPQYFQNFLID